MRVFMKFVSAYFIFLRLTAYVLIAPPCGKEMNNKCPVLTDSHYFNINTSLLEFACVLIQVGQYLMEFLKNALFGQSLLLQNPDDITVHSSGRIRAHGGIYSNTYALSDLVKYVQRSDCHNVPSYSVIFERTLFIGIIGRANGRLLQSLTTGRRTHSALNLRSKHMVSIQNIFLNF